jgi:DNA-binding CsgD family transcriptional regulator/PAS domain-containing protein
MLTLQKRTPPGLRWPDDQSGDSMAQAADQPRGATRGDSLSFDDLLYLLFDSLHGTAPWTRFLSALCDQVQGYTATLVLRQPALGDRGDLFDVHTVKSVVEVYRTTSFEDDPFLDIREGEVCTIYDLITHEQLVRSHYYNDLLKLDGIVDILALNIAFGDDYVGSLKIARRSGSPPFGLLEKSLVMRLYPPIKLALSIYERNRRQTIENRAYARAIDQLAFGVIILNERGHVVRINATATALLGDSRLLVVAGNRLLAGSAEDDDRVSRVIKAALAGEAPRDPVKLTDKNTARPLYMLLKPIQDAEGADAGVMGVAIFLSSGSLERSVAIDTCASLYGLSKAEVALLTELVDGASILSASLILGISEHTARAQLRSIFIKTDTHRQADLFRLVLTSLAIIA